MKKFKYILSCAFLATLGLTACQDDFDDPAMQAPVATLTPNTTIGQLKEMYWNDAQNCVDTIRLTDSGEHIIIAGRVISSDAAGNIYKNLVIQDATGALTMSINANSLYNTYRVGQEVVIDATDMFIGKYSGLQQLGFPDYSESFGWQTTFMPLQFFKEHAQLNGLPDPAKVDTITVRDFSEISSTPEGLRKWQSQLVRFNNCHFALGGQATFTDAHKTNSNRDLVLSDGTTINVRNSGYANFWGKTLPAGNGDVVGILSYFNNSWQLLLRSESDCMNFGNPTLSPGTEENPYTVDQAIEEQIQGNQASGWVTGYIVGAVAPGVAQVTGDSDIQWGANVDMPNTIVIAASPAVKSIASCLIVPLPQSSALRQYGALANNPALYQRQIWLNGTLETISGSYGMTCAGRAADFRIEGIEVGDGSIPDGNGTQATPYNVTQVKGLGNPGSVSYVTGYIVGWVEGAALSSGAHFTVPATNAANVLLAATPDETNVDKCIPVQLPYGSKIRTAVNLVDNPGNLGKKLTLEGTLQAYFNTTGIKSPTDNFTLDGAGSGDVPPVTGTVYTGLSEDAATIDWTFDAVSGPSNVWSWKNYNNKHYLNASAYVGGAASAAEAYAVSPVIDLAGVAKPVLTFDHAAKFQTTLRTLCGLVVRESGAASWTEVAIPVWPEAGAWTFVSSGSIDLSAWTGKKIQIGFKYGSTTSGADTWEIKNVKIVG